MLGQIKYHIVKFMPPMSDEEIFLLVTVLCNQMLGSYRLFKCHIGPGVVSFIQSGLMLGLYWPCN
jgi:hypothetical protein